MKQTYIDAIDEFYKNIEELNDSEDVFNIYNEFKKLERDLKENHLDTKKYWSCYGNWFGDYNGIIFISYVDGNGELFADTMELEAT